MVISSITDAIFSLRNDNVVHRNATLLGLNYLVRLAKSAQLAYAFMWDVNTPFAMMKHPARFSST